MHLSRQRRRPDASMVVSARAGGMSSLSSSVSNPVVNTPERKRVGWMGKPDSPPTPSLSYGRDDTEASEATSIQHRRLNHQAVLLALARYRGPSGDGRLDALRLRYAMTAVGMSEYEQRVVLGGEFSSARADLVQCAANIVQYSEYEYDRCEDFLEKLDHADLSYWAEPQAFATVLYGLAVADHRKNGSDSAVKRAWDMLNLILIFYFFVSSTFVNVLHFTWDDSPEMPNGSRLVESYYGVTAFWVIDLFLTTQLSTTDEEGHVLMQPSQIMRQKALVIAIDVVSILPLDFIFQAARVWYAFVIFRYAKYIKVFRTIFLFEVVNRSIVTKGRLRFYYELKPIFIGLFWLVVVLHSAAILHSFTDQFANNGQRRYPLFIQSFIVVTASLTGSPANVYAYNNYDRVLIITLMLVTLVLQGVVVAKFSALLLSRDVEDENLRHLRATLSMVGHYKVPKAIQREVLSYQMHDLNDHASHHMQDLAVLPERMLGDVKTYSKISAVRQVPLFADESRECQELLAKMLQRREFPPEKAMVSFGEIGDDMFMITHGYAEVIIFNGLIVATLSRGDFFGEVALFSEDGKRMATVRALTYVDAWRLARKQFLIVCARYEDFFAKIMAEVEKRGVNSDAFKKAVEKSREEGESSGDEEDSEEDLFARVNFLDTNDAEAERNRRASDFRNRRGTVTFGALNRIVENAMAKKSQRHSAAGMFGSHSPSSAALMSFSGMSARHSAVLRGDDEDDLTATSAEAAGQAGDAPYRDAFGRMHHRLDGANSELASVTKSLEEAVAAFAKRSRDHGVDLGFLDTDPSAAAAPQNATPPHLAGAAVD